MAEVLNNVPSRKVLKRAFVGPSTTFTCLTALEWRVLWQHLQLRTLNFLHITTRARASLSSCPPPAPLQVTAEVLKSASNLKVVGRAGVGIDNIDVPECTKAGVMVMNTPGGNTVSTAQLAVTLLCAAARLSLIHI